MQKSEIQKLPYSPAEISVIRLSDDAITTSNGYGGNDNRGEWDAQYPDGRYI